MLQSEVIHRSTSEVCATIYRQRFDILGIRKENGATVVNLHLTGGVVHGSSTVNLDILQIGKKFRRLDIVEYEYSMVGGRNVYTAVSCKRHRARDMVIHIIGNCHC